MKGQMSWPKDATMLDGGRIAQMRANTVQQKRGGLHGIDYAAGFHCLVE